MFTIGLFATGLHSLVQSTPAASGVNLAQGTPAVLKNVLIMSTRHKGAIVLDNEDDKDDDSETRVTGTPLTSRKT